MERFLPFNRRFIEHYVLRVTRLVASRVLSPCRKMISGTGAVSRYRFKTEPGICHGTES
jgi:hypothetical protein